MPHQCYTFAPGPAHPLTHPVLLPIPSTGTLQLTARLELDGPRLTQLMADAQALSMHDSETQAAPASSSPGPKLRSALSMPTLDDMGTEPLNAASAKSHPAHTRPGSTGLMKATSK
jgi:hypothetical protein